MDGSMTKAELIAALHKARPADEWYVEFFDEGYQIGIGWVTGVGRHAVKMTCWANPHTIPSDAVSFAVNAFDAWHARKAAA
jgi:hypothetical protein